MLESIVLHQSGTGVRGGDGNIVGISWTALTRSHPSPSLVVTCTHQVVVYKPGESRRTHQWSFKPSAATALSHAAVFLPAGSRYVGVQQGSTLVSWRESELDVKRPLSAQARARQLPYCSVHACPQLGDYFVAVLSSGGVALYQGGLQLAARCDEAAGGALSVSPANAKARSNAKSNAKASVHAKAAWSGVRGNKVLVLENIGATDRVTTFVLSVPTPQRRTSASAGADGAGAANASASASVTLVSSHVLTKPLSLAGGSVGAAAGGGAGAPEEEEASLTACAAAFLGGEGEGGRGVVSVAWRTSRGPAWTKVVLDAAGAREELARPVATAAAAMVDAMVESNGSGFGEVGGPVVSVSNGHGGSPKKVSARSKKSAEAGDSGGAGRWSSVPAVASADGGRLLVHSGGATPRLAIWDAGYGVLLDDDGAPGSEVGGNAAGKAVGKAVSMAVSGDGAHVGISAAGRVLICPLPVNEDGTLASLLRRKRPSFSSAVATAAAAGGGVGPSGLAFPSVDLARNGPASSLLGRSGALVAAEWEAAVVVPFREAEAKVIQSLHGAARRKDRDAFERVLREHGQRRASAAAAAGGGSSDVAEGVVGEGGQEGRKRRRRREGRDGEDFSPGVVAAAVELCLKNPGAELWNSLAVLLRSGGVSARHHRGLVASIVKHASPELLEEARLVMLHVPDLPEADAVHILRHFLALAAVSAQEPPAVPATAAPAAAAVAGALVASDSPPTDSAGVPHPAKRARGTAPIAGKGFDDGVAGIAVEVLSSPKSGSRDGDKEESASTAKKSKKKEGVVATVAAAGAVAEGLSRHKHANGAMAPNLSNGNGMHAAAAAAATQEDGGMSGDSGGYSKSGVKEAGTPPGTGDAEVVAKNTGKSKKKRARVLGGVGFEEGTPAARAERGVRVALMFPHNEAFLRSALAGLSHGEVVVVLKVLTRLIAEGRTKESSARSAVNRRGGASKTARGLPPARTDLVLAWAAAVLDAHFARLAVGGAADAGLVSALKALKRAMRGEGSCCELLCEVRSLVDELGRQHAAAATAAVAAAASKRHPKRDLFTLRVLRF
ncbi:unnamed protein product [Laminaria digitata]